LGLFLSRLRTFCEHDGAAATPGSCFVRSHEPNAIDRLFFYTLNFNYHVEHHLYPQVPSHQLPAVHEVLVRSSYFDITTRSTSIVGTVAARLAAAR
jgi:fatty acid desaturase